MMMIKQSAKPIATLICRPEVVPPCYASTILLSKTKHSLSNNSIKMTEISQNDSFKLLLYMIFIRRRLVQNVNSDAMVLNSSISLKN